jgi:hypothetical protein
MRRSLRLGYTGCFFAVLFLGVLLAAAMGIKVLLEEFIERNFIFFPEKVHSFTPGEWGLDAEDVFFQTADGVKLHAWHIRGPQNAPLILWFHGNAGNISDRVENAKLLVDRDLSLFMPDYRGYGKSEGVPSEKGIYLDGEAAYDYLVSQANVAPGGLIIFGRSLGACVAVSLAAKNPCAGVILESGFTNMADMAGAHSVIPGMGAFSRKFDSLGKIAKVAAPILFFHGDQDEIVPYALGRKLFEAARSEKEFYTIAGAHHNDTYHLGGKAYFDKFEAFAREQTGGKKPPS